MEYISLGNFELYPDQLNWSVPGISEDYFGMPQKYINLLNEPEFEEFLGLKIGKGWRLPYLNEMNYIGDVTYRLGITKSKKLYMPTAYSYIVQETLDPSVGERKTFFSLENRASISMPWIPGYFLTNAAKRTFKIQPVRDINF